MLNNAENDDFENIVITNEDLMTEERKRLFGYLERLAFIMNSNPVFNSAPYRCDKKNLYQLIGRQTFPGKHSYKSDSILERLTCVERLVQLLNTINSEKRPSATDLNNTVIHIMESNNYNIKKIILFQIADEAYTLRMPDIITKVIEILDLIRVIFSDKQLKNIYDNEVIYPWLSQTKKVEMVQPESVSYVGIHSKEISNLLDDIWQDICGETNTNEKLKNAKLRVNKVLDQISYLDKQYHNKILSIIERFLSNDPTLEQSYAVDIETILQPVSDGMRYMDYPLFLLFAVINYRAHKHWTTPSEYKILKEKNIPIAGSFVTFSQFSDILNSKLKKSEHFDFKTIIHTLTKLVSSKKTPKELTENKSKIKKTLFEKLSLDLKYLIQGITYRNVPIEIKANEEFSFEFFNSFLRFHASDLSIYKSSLKEYIQKHEASLNSIDSNQVYELTMSVSLFIKHHLNCIVQSRNHSEYNISIQNIITMYTVCREHLGKFLFAQLFHNKQVHAQFEKSLSSMNPEMALLTIRFLLEVGYLEMEPPESFGTDSAGVIY